MGAAAGDNDFLYYTIVQPGDAPGPKDTTSMSIIKADMKTGKTVKSQSLPTDV